jgi:hypothetical protein
MDAIHQRINRGQLLVNHLEHIVGAFRGESRVALDVVAVVVVHAVLAHLPELAGARGADGLGLGPRGGVGRVLARVDAGLVALGGGAAVHPEVGVGRDERHGAPVDLDAAALRGPLAAVPHAQVERHRAVRRVVEVGHDALQVPEHPNRSIINVKHQQVLVPLEVVVMILRCSVKPQINLLLTPPCPVHENIRVQNIRLPRNIAEKLKVEFAVVRSRGR